MVKQGGRASKSTLKTDDMSHVTMIIGTGFYEEMPNKKYSEELLKAAEGLLLDPANQDLSKVRPALEQAGKLVIFMGHEFTNSKTPWHFEIEGGGEFSVQDFPPLNNTDLIIFDSCHVNPRQDQWRGKFKQGTLVISGHHGKTHRTYGKTCRCRKDESLGEFIVHLEPFEQLRSFVETLSESPELLKDGAQLQELWATNAEENANEYRWYQSYLVPSFDGWIVCPCQQLGHDEKMGSSS